MVELYGRGYTRKELLERVGDIAQLGGVRLAELADGRGRGVRVADFRTGSGLEFTVHIDRGMDIGAASFCGDPLTWCSPAGVVGPAYYDPRGIGWTKGFPGGLLATCGLSHAGAPTVDQGEELGLHGPISYAPAEGVWADGIWRGNNYEMFVQGRVRESHLFGPKLELSRRVWARLGDTRIFVSDTVTNTGGETVPFMIIYHCNFGFPLLDDVSELIAPSIEVLPATDIAAAGLERYGRFQEPEAGYQEQVFYHRMVPDAQGYVTVALANHRQGVGRGLGAYMRYRQRELPRFVEWKMMDVRDYVVGLEPANCWPGLGRTGERERGTLEFLEPGESRDFTLEFGILPDNGAIERFEQDMQQAHGRVMGTERGLGI